MAELHLKPAREGDIIRDPISGRVMPPEGETKPRNPHWLRRLGRGEVIETTADAIAQGKTEREAKEAAVTSDAEADIRPVADMPPEAKPRKGKE
ncbi:DUF2635 domain-containing protein [Magnetospirillum fulvum]|uniref:DUF2635 domain-containing protein n=1 Tax=Magnetospirillum fulvum MGU-K5 TaxID=1316936 RepID=S9S4J1_MAGFU|nr:DUF2635 domain-containing protein [Magnetospirillum fulvum]EPY00882.1 hypothetical protein K678_13980 [Magnetospirillum fulvum MGU-K5]